MPEPTIPPTHVVLTDLDIPFGSLMAFIFKAALAAIPALFFLSLLLGAILGFLTFLGTGLASLYK